VFSKRSKYTCFNHERIFGREHQILPTKAAEGKFTSTHSLLVIKFRYYVPFLIPGSAVSMRKS